MLLVQAKFWMFFQLPIAEEAFWFSAMLGRPRHYLSPPLSPVSTSTAWSTTEKGRDDRRLCVSLSDVHRQEMGSSKKSHSGTAREGQGEEELLSELCHFQNVSLFSQSSSPSQLLSKVVLQGSMSAPQGHLSDENSLPEPVGPWRGWLCMSQSYTTYTDAQTILLGTGKSQIPDSFRN